MSAQFLQSYTPAENQTIRVNSAIIRGDCVVSGVTQCDGSLIVSSSLTYANIPSANIVQLTSPSTEINATGVANAYNFNVETFTSTLAAGANTRFFLAMPAGVLNSYGFASVSVYYYSNVVGTGGIPILSIITQENDKVLLLLENKDPANALNGNIHFRFKYDKGTVA